MATCEMKGFYKVEMNRDEIQFIRDLMNHVGGNSNKSRRGLADNIARTIDLCDPTLANEEETPDADGNVWFKEIS